MKNNNKANRKKNTKKKTVKQRKLENDDDIKLGR